MKTKRSNLSHDVRKGFQKDIRDNERAICATTNKLRLKPHKFALTVLHRENKLHDGIFSLYLCKHCNNYHLMTTDKRNKFKENMDKLNKLLAAQ
jgi:hypothetical protein